MLLILEGLVMAFWLLLVCVVGIRNGAVGLVTFYEKDVQDRVVKLGLTTPERIKKSSAISARALFLPLLTVVPAVVWFYNGVDGFLDGFFQLTVIYMIMNLFDRLFVDVFWVGHTKTWEIPGTEDLKPYIPAKRHLAKWVGTCMGFPLLAAIISLIISCIR